MDYIYFIPLISFTGLIFGILLAKIAYEEIKPGLVYFKWLKRVILACLIVVLLLNVKNSILFLFIGVVLGYLSSFFLETYFYLGLGSILSFLFSKNLFFLTNILVFLFGLPEGTLLRKFTSLYKNFILFVIPFLVLIFDSSSIISLLIGICSGGLFSFFIKRDLFFIILEFRKPFISICLIKKEGKERIKRED